MLELYHAEPVANSAKVLLCLKEKGLGFVSHYVDLLRFEQHQPDFLAVNPKGQVPVLVHDGQVITESTIVNEYLDDVFPDVPLRPESMVERARMRIWNKFVDEFFCPALSMIGWHRMVRMVAKSLEEDELEQVLSRIPLADQRRKWAVVAGESFTEEQLEDSRYRLVVSVAQMEQMLSEGEWLAGDSYSLADINAYPMAAGVPRMFPELVNDMETPFVWNWLERMNARPAVQAMLAMPNKVPETLRTFI